MTSTLPLTAPPSTVSFADVLAARDALAPHLPPTPVWAYPALDEVAGATVYVKHENTQPTGAFKVRGALNLLTGMTAAERRRGFVTWSTGNHALAIAYACAATGAPCTVVVPDGTDPGRIRALRATGATVVEHGPDLEAAAAHALTVADGATPVSPGDTPALIAGVGTAYLELFTARPDLDAVVVPVGSGTGAAAACLVAAELAPRCEIIAVQAADSPAGHDSWRSGRIERRPNRTRVAGLATGSGFPLPQRLIRDRLADFVLLPDDRIAAAAALLASHAHTLAEGAGAAALAAVLADPGRFAGRRVAVVCTGGNASAAEIAALSARSALSA